MSPIPDMAERSRALDPLQSFCVTAPAGSGKTELLIQRYLTLLARAEQPEQVLAITFTRKAAAEMRERILAALSGAAEDRPPEGDHAILTWTLARSALEADRDRAWFLQDNPARLNIKTIDSFCAALARQLPVLSGFGGAVTVTDDPGRCYRLAVRELLAKLEREPAESAELRELLLLYDNNWSKIEALLMRLLARRDQWLAYIGRGLQPLPAMQALESTAIAVIEGALEDLHESLDEQILEQLWTLLGYSADNLGLPLPVHPLNPAQAQLGDWKRLVTLLLTQKGDWRKAVNKNQGFPTDAGEGKDAALQMKEQLAAMIANLSSRANTRDLLVSIQVLPEIGEGSEDWDRVIGISHLLPKLAAELMLAFQQEAVADYPQVALAARLALGEDDNPTNLALRLDYQIQHILLDEFQDTSMSQFELVRRLTREWAGDNEMNPLNPKTFFIVGDGMQSIYGFRDADVGLFMHARDLGFNRVVPDALTLSSNFRSDPRLVSWVNETFVDAFPAEDNIGRGEIAFSPAVAVREQDRSAAVSQRLFLGETEAARQAEAEAVAGVVEEGLQDPDCESVAILVRTRSHLSHIIGELKRRNISWQAENIDPLRDSEVVGDLMNLCLALHNPADRVAWLALLRAPWCGLSLDELLDLVGSDRHSAVWSLIRDALDRQSLAPETLGRLQHVEAAIGNAMDYRERHGLRELLESCWENLGGPACVSSPGQLDDAEEFLCLLEGFDNRGEAFTAAAMYQAVDTLYSSVSGADSRVQLMTLHKSKGLEFDRVIIPGLARTSRSDRRELLLWGQFHNRGETGFLLAVDDPARQDDTNLYNFLKQYNRRKARLENTRLLYVGATRAVRQLYLFASLSETAQGDDYGDPPEASLLHSIWSGFQRGMSIVADAEDARAGGPSGSAAVTGLRRLSRVSCPGLRSTALPDEEGPNLPEPADNRLQRAIGTAVHAGLQRFSGFPISDLETLELSEWRDWVAGQLRDLFVSPGALDVAIASVLDSLDRVLADRKGRWLVAADREQSVSEYPLTTLRDDGRLLEMIIDRAFVDEGIRWVVDYKNSRPADGEGLVEFLAREEQRYAAQLRNYREAFEQRESNPVKTALYFTSIGHWHECSGVPDKN